MNIILPVIWPPFHIYAFLSVLFVPTNVVVSLRVLTFQNQHDQPKIKKLESLKE